MHVAINFISLVKFIIHLSRAHREIVRMLVPPTNRGRFRLASGDVWGGVTLVTRLLTKASLPLVNHLVFFVSSSLKAGKLKW